MPLGIIALILISFVTSCDSGPPTIQQAVGGATVELVIPVPEVGVFTNDEIAPQSLIRSYSLQVEGVDCEDSIAFAENFNRQGPVNLQVWLNPYCDYNIAVELGQFGTNSNSTNGSQLQSTNSLSNTYYNNLSDEGAGYVIKSVDLKNKTRVIFRPVYTITPDGVDAGFTVRKVKLFGESNDTQNDGGTGGNTGGIGGNTGGTGGNTGGTGGNTGGTGGNTGGTGGNTGGTGGNTGGTGGNGGTGGTGGNTGGTGGNGGTGTPTPALNGAALYAQYCAGCHGAAKQISTANATRQAIELNIGGMGSLNALTSEQLLAIDNAY